MSLYTSDWGSEEDGNALSRHALDVSEGNGYAVIESNRIFQITPSYSILLWFKTNGLPDDYSQLLSKRESGSYSYVFQVNPGGTSLEALYRAEGFETVYASSGKTFFKLNEWNCFLSTYDGDFLRSYINGKLAGTLNLRETPLKDNGSIGVGGGQDGSFSLKGG